MIESFFFAAQSLPRFCSCDSTPSKLQNAWMRDECDTLRTLFLAQTPHARFAIDAKNKRTCAHWCSRAKHQFGIDRTNAGEAARRALTTCRGTEMTPHEVAP